MRKQSLLQKRKVASWEANPQHQHGGLETYLLHYQIDAARMTNWLLYSNRVMQGGTVE